MSHQLNSIPPPCPMLYALERGYIHVNVKKKEDSDVVKISISDTGIGIKRSQHEIIFEPFRQGDEKQNREFAGVGLGLFIAKNYMEQLGGTIRFTSIYGKGTTFTITLKDYVFILEECVQN